MASPRVWVLGQRGLHNTVARTISIESEDVFVDVSGAELLLPSHSRTSEVRQRLQRAASRRLPAASRFDPGYRLDDPGGECDLLFMVCAFQRDVTAISALSDWQGRAGTKVLWLEDLWLDDVERWPAYLELMSQFDRIYLNFAQAVDRLAELTGTPTSYAPFAVDALRFCPYPDPPERFIDVMNVGRRSRVTHEALRARPELMLHYDTTAAGAVKDPQEHRMQYAAFAQRSRFFIANRAKFQNRDQDRHAPEIGARFFEGAAAGAVLIGDHPGGAQFDEHFGWNDALIRQPSDAPNIGDLVDDLLAQPGRLADISRRNVTECLRRHDWAHRFALVAADVGLERHPRLQERLANLEVMASKVDG